MPIIKEWGLNERPRTDDLTVSISVGTPPRQRELWKKRQASLKEKQSEPSGGSPLRASIFAEPEAFFDVDGELVTLDTVNCRAFREASGTKEEIDFSEFLHIWTNFPRISSEEAAKLRAGSRLTDSSS